MTKPPPSRRKAPAGAAVGIPDFVARLFRGEGDCVLVHAYPYWVMLWEYWREWARANPGARPPVGFEHLAAPPPAKLEGMDYDEAVRVARRYAARA